MPRVGLEPIHDDLELPEYLTLLEQRFVKGFMQELVFVNSDPIGFGSNANLAEIKLDGWRQLSIFMMQSDTFSLTRIDDMFTFKRLDNAWTVQGDKLLFDTKYLAYVTIMYALGSAW